MRPPFLLSGGEENFNAYQTEFDALFCSGFNDILGNEVIFSQNRCHHICYKSEDKKWNKGRRDQWIQARAERIPWIYAALKTPDFIRISYGEIWAYLLAVEQDRENNLPPELFVAIVNSNGVKPNRPGTVYFMTGYTITFKQWNEFKKNHPWIYPPDTPKAQNSRKKNK